MKKVTITEKKPTGMIGVLESKEEGLYTATNGLARIWRHFLYKKGVTGAEWYRQLTKYHERIKRLTDSKTAAGVKGNANTRLAMDKVSWESLIRGFDIMEAEEVRITITPVIGGVEYPIDLVIENSSFDDESYKGRSKEK